MFFRKESETEKSEDVIIRQDIISSTVELFFCFVLKPFYNRMVTSEQLLKGVVQIFIIFNQNLGLSFSDLQLET